ncbi:hypothetical protein FACS1894163_10530 [Spirochaetia bacterium]|nr:hypothetical protein FACS1894163_10530 [Spirochaetia bacterium]
MNLLKLKEYHDGTLVYEYQPEGKGESGEVLFDIANMQGRLLKKAADDSPASGYGQKALLKVEELVQRNNIPIQCTQAWY